MNVVVCFVWFSQSPIETPNSSESILGAGFVKRRGGFLLVLPKLLRMTKKKPYPVVTPIQDPVR